MYYKMTLLAVLTVTGLQAERYPLMEEHLSPDSIVSQRCLESSTFPTECADIEAYFAALKKASLNIAQTANEIDADASKGDDLKQREFSAAFEEINFNPSTNDMNLKETAKNAVREILSSETSKERLYAEDKFYEGALINIIIGTLATSPLAARIMFMATLHRIEQINGGPDIVSFVRYSVLR